MNARRRDTDQLLQPGVLLNLMQYLANLKFPSRLLEHSENLEATRYRGDTGPGLLWGNKPEVAEVIYDPRDKPEFVAQLRARTERYWPDLWSSEDRACQVLKRIQVYLQRFWREPDPRIRDWYIARARHLIQRFRVQNELGEEFQQKLETVNDALRLNDRIEEALDNPPVLIPFEEALYKLQKRALIPSRRPLYCPNHNCKKPYFLSDKKGKKFCSTECARPSLLESKRLYAEERRRKNG